MELFISRIIFIIFIIIIALLYFKFLNKELRENKEYKKRGELKSKDTFFTFTSLFLSVIGFIFFIGLIILNLPGLIEFLLLLISENMDMEKFLMYAVMILINIALISIIFTYFKIEKDYKKHKVEKDVKEVEFESLIISIFHLIPMTFPFFILTDFAITLTIIKDLFF